MAISDFNETYAHGKDFITNHYRMRRIKDRILLTTDCGGWVILEKKEYDSILRHELPNGLYKMLEEKCIILTKNNINRLLHYQKERLDFLFRGASLHIIIPTLRCNHKCVYCHSSAAHSQDADKDMDINTANDVLNFIFQTPSKAITIEFQGGETLINYEIFRHIVKTAKEMNKSHNKLIRFSLVTNLTLMTNEYMDWLSWQNIDICTSIDGPKHVHDNNRRYETGAGSYDDVTRWLDVIKNQYDKRISALMVTTRHSIPYWKEIIDEYIRWGINNIQIKHLNKLGFAQNTWHEIGYTAEEFIDFWKKCVDYMIELNKKGVSVKERYASLILQKIFTTRDPSFLDFRSPCGIAIGQLAYNYNGDIYCCDEGRSNEIFRLGNANTSTYAEVIAQEQTLTLVSSSINENFACDNCAYKPYCGVCPVLSHSENGNILPKLPCSTKCKIFKMQFDYIFEKMLNDEDKNVLMTWVFPPK